MDLAFLLFVGLGQLAYVVPTLVAIRRRHPSGVAILVLNVFLGWTVLGWVGALVWACAALPAPRDPWDTPPTGRLLLYAVLACVILGAAVALLLVTLAGTHLR